MIYPLVRDLAADGIPVKVTCRVLGFSPQAFYKWLEAPVSKRDWENAHLIDLAHDVHTDAPEFGYRMIAGVLALEQGVHVSSVWHISARSRHFFWMVDGCSPVSLGPLTPPPPPEISVSLCNAGGFLDLNMHERKTPPSE